MPAVYAYLKQINAKFRTGISTEHTYRTYLQSLLEELAPDRNLNITNEPTRIQCGAPDFIIRNREIPLGYIEAKDVGADLDSKQYREQFKRYRVELDNLIITDYLEFRLFRYDQEVARVRLGVIEQGRIRVLPEDFTPFHDLISEFFAFTGQTVKSAAQLARMMAGKARLLSSTIAKALELDEEQAPPSVYTAANHSLQDQLTAFRNVLIHDITSGEFADIYAQTITYGMFAARLHDPTLEDFSRMEAAELIPHTNPFLRKLFQYVAGYDLDDRIVWVVDALADIFRATDVAALLEDFGKTTQTRDPIIHFYETFLAEYDPKLRKARGVWYTPAPVVNFIVRAVDDILKTEFNLPQGLADTSKIKIKVDTQTADRRSATGFKQQEQEIHRVQILDPAAGTGTFLAEVVRQIYQKFAGQQGIWSSYVEEHLLPRLNGFELLMASYAMAHLKLEMLLRETGYQPQRQQRFRIYLTNSLEEHHQDTGTLFASWLSSEANEANHIKRDTPVMVVMGNPPYSGESANKGEWIMQLMEDYKKEPGGKEKLREKNPKWINDDYVKFIRYGQHFIEKNGEGILAFINAHGFLDNPTFRGMRWNLLKTYNKIYVMDLHGNSKKKEKCPDGSRDENVFDIQQGVSINLFIKTGRKKSNELGDLYHADLYGSREIKYKKLLSEDIHQVEIEKLAPSTPQYFFVPKDLILEKQYSQGFILSELFPVDSVGIVTARDAFTIHDTEQQVKTTIETFLGMDDEAARQHFNLGRDVLDWKVHLARQDLIESGPDYTRHLVPIDYRPFDTRYTYYTGHSKGFHCRPRGGVMKHFLLNNNIGLVIGRQGQVVGSMPWNLSFIAKEILDFNSYYRGGGVVFPLYLYPDGDQQSLDSKSTRTPNLNPEIVGQIAAKLGLTFTAEKEETAGSFAPIDLLDYIYALLHSPTYRDKYKEFLKIDFPRVPYPEQQETFWQLVAPGGELRQIHLLESPVVEQPITTFPVDGNNEITRRLTGSDWELTDDQRQLGRIWINDSQYFGDIPLVAWEFYIGGYQPAQKWLKDRRKRPLSFEDVSHYQKIIVALTETDRLMREIDSVKIEES